MSFDSGAPPETKKRTRPPVLAVIFEKTSLAAIAWRRLSPAGTGFPSIFRAPYALPTLRAQKKIFRRSAGLVRTWSMTLV